MSTTIMRILRDSKLNDDESVSILFRTSLIKRAIQDRIELSTLCDGVLSTIQIPYTVESAMDLLSLSNTLLKLILAQDTGKLFVTDEIGKP